MLCELYGDSVEESGVLTNVLKQIAHKFRAVKCVRIKVRTNTQTHLTILWRIAGMRDGLSSALVGARGMRLL